MQPWAARTPGAGVITQCAAVEIQFVTVLYVPTATRVTNVISVTVVTVVTALEFRHVGGMVGETFARLPSRKKFAYNTV